MYNLFYYFQITRPGAFGHPNAPGAKGITGNNMAVLANKRRVSEIEYENVFVKFLNYVSAPLSRVPKRHHRYLVSPFIDTLSDAYETVTHMTNEFVSNKKNGIDRYRSCAKLLNAIEEIIKFSYSYWAISSDKKNQIKFVKYKQRKSWAAIINKLCSVVIWVMDKCKKDTSIKVDIHTMSAYSNRDFKDAIFIDKLSHLHRFLYDKALLTSKNIRNIQIETALSLSKSALFNAVSGNNIYVVDDGSLLNKRSKYFSDCISNLKAMSRPVREIAFDHLFSESDLNYICNLISECQRILIAIKNSDNERIKNNK